MARVAQLNQNPKDTQQTTAGGQQPTQIQATNPFTGQSAPTAPATGGSRFTNVSSYLKANEGAGEKIAEKVGSKVQQTVNKTAAQQTEAESFRGAVDAEKDRLAQASGMAEQAKNNATAISSNQEQLDAWNKLYNPQGTSTQQITDAANMAGRITSAMSGAGQQVANLGTESGRFDLLGQTFARPNYSQGQKRLDQLLLSVGGAQQLGESSKNLSSQLMDRANTIDNITKYIGQQVGTNAQAEADASALLKNTINTSLGDFRQAQVEEARAANATNSQINEALNAYFSGGASQLSPEQMQIVQGELAKGNLSSDMRTYNVTSQNKWQDFINQGRTDLGAGDVITADELANYQALGTLGQLNPTGMEFTAAGSGANTSALKAQELSDALAAARTSLLNRFAGEELTKGMNYNTGQVYAGTGPSIYDGTEYVDAYANLGNLLSGYESGNTTANISSRDASGSGTQTFNVQGDTLVSTDGGTPLPIVQDLWRSFLSRLDQEGYNSVLGGSGPTTNTFGVS